MTQAFSTKEKTSYSARTTWGVFRLHGQVNVIVLEMWYDRVTYPQLRKLAQRSIL